MKSPPLYRVRSYPLRLLIEQNYSLDYDLAHDRKYEVLQQDNLLFRHIRHITGHTRKFNPFVIFVDTKGVSNYADAIQHVVTDGILVDGRRYLFSERSASMTRCGIFSFVDADIFDELSERITLGWHPDKIVLSKYYAYRGLAFSSCFPLEEWAHNLPKMIVVPDCFVLVKDQHIKYLYDKTTMLTNKDGVQFPWTQKDIAEKITDIEINAFDGVGLIHPDLAKEVERMIGSDSPVTSFICRSCFIKGCLHAIDYTSFMHSRGVDYIEDIWHHYHSVDDKMIILTESMWKAEKWFKVYGDGRDWDHFLSLLDQYDWTIGIAKYNFSEDYEPLQTRMNYQILQDLNLPFDRFESLANPSKEWAEKIIYGDPLYTYAFLGLTANKLNPINAYAQAVLRNPEMLNEPSVGKYLKDSLKKYIDDMKAGKLWTRGSFKFLVPDLIAMMEWIGHLEVRGCLESGEFYSRDETGVFEGTYLVERNPHICRSEHALMQAKVTPDIERYVGHLTNIAMVNSKSLIAQRLNGADYDGDLVLVIKNETMFDGVDPTLPIVIDVEDKITTIVEPDTIDGRIGLTMRTMGSLIGKYSNFSSALYAKVTKDPDLKAKFLKYIDIVSVCVGKAVDFAKSGVLFKVPHFIEVAAKPMPYFMKYRSPYYAKLDLSKSWSNMNRLAFSIEKWEKRLSWARTKHFDYHIMIDDSLYVPPDVADAVEQIFLSYNKEMKELIADQRRIRAYEDDDVREQLSRYDATNFVADFGSIYEKYKQQCAAVCPDQKVLANICVRLVFEKYKTSRSKFHWVVAERGVIDNIKQVPVIQLPKRDPAGPYEYLGRRYSLVDVDMSEPQADLDADEFEEFDEWEDMDF